METLIAVAILGLTLTVLLAAVSTGSLAVSGADERAVAENLALRQARVHEEPAPYRCPPRTRLSRRRPATQWLSTQRRYRAPTPPSRR